MVGSSSWTPSWRRAAACAGFVTLCIGLIGAPAGAAKKGVTAPGAPTITSVTAGVHRVKVVFAAPTSNGGAQIQSYRVKCVSSDGGKTAVRSGHASPIRVVGLTAKTYTCTVVARNLAGHGPPSAASDPVTVLAH